MAVGTEWSAAMPLPGKQRKKERKKERKDRWKVRDVHKMDYNHANNNFSIEDIKQGAALKK